MPTLYKVGELYNPQITQWPEQVEYNYRAGAHELRIAYESPDQKEIDIVSRGEARFALYPYKDVIFFCSKFGDNRWDDSSYSIHLVRPAEQQLPEDLANAAQRQLLTIYMIDANTGLLLTMRAVSFSPEFTRILHAAIWKQHAKPFPADYDQQIKEIYNKYTTREIATKLALVRCRGGA